MYWYANGTTLVSDGACYRLPNPPGGIGAELMTPAIIEFFGGADKANISFLDEIEEWNSATHVFFCDTDHEP